MIRAVTAFSTKTIEKALVNVSKTLNKQPVPNTGTPIPNTVTYVPKIISKPPVSKTVSKPPVPFEINPVEFNKNLRAWEKELIKNNRDYKKLCDKKEQDSKFEMSPFMDWS